MKRKRICWMFLFLLLIMGNLSFAQCDPPTNVNMTIEPLNHRAGMNWDVDSTGMIDHYEVFLDGVETGSINQTFGFVEFTPNQGSNLLTYNTYHDAGVRAVNINGIASEAVTFHFYYSPTAYGRPFNLRVENNLENSTALFLWDEPPYGGGEGEPAITGYSVYLNGIYVLETTELNCTFNGLAIGTNYVAGLITHYSDGYDDSTFYHNYSKTEFYFDELTAPVNLTVNESNGLLSWSKPNCDGDIIGGTFTGYPVAEWFELGWYTGEQYTTFGDSTRFVNTRWGIRSWIHNKPFDIDREEIYFEMLGEWKIHRV